MMPTLAGVLALLGAALMTLAIFAPRKPLPLPPSPIAREIRYPAPREPLAPAEPQWPLLADPRAAACDATTRLALIAALADLRVAWADEILHRAYAEETDPVVRSALVALRVEHARM
jgi:hypothetical protein